MSEPISKTGTSPAPTPVGGPSEGLDEHGGVTEIRGTAFRIRSDPRRGAAARSVTGPAAWDALLARAAPVPGGRSENRILEGEGRGDPVRLRPGRRGGWLGAWLGDRYASPARVFREFELLRALEVRRIDCARAVLAVARRRGLFWTTTLGTVELEGTCDAARWLEAGPSAEAIEAAATATAHTLRACHDAGVLHGDLQLRNLMIGPVDAPTLRCTLIDFDRARQVEAPTPAARMREAMRLLRSVEKRGLSERVPSAVRARWLEAYCAGDAALERAMRQALPRERRRLARHRLGWRLARRLGRSGSSTGALVAFLLQASLGLCVLGPLGCEAQPTPIERPTEAPRRSLLAVGDTGRERPFPSLFEGQRAVARGMTAEARVRPVDGLVLLGDNFYWDGLHRSELIPRIETNLVAPYCYFLRLDGPRSREVEEACATPPEERAPVPILAVLGNHDIEHTESIVLQRTLLPEFLPDWRISPGLADVVELGDGISLILFESEPAIDDREAVAEAIASAVSRAAGPWRILATHRPIATDDLGNRRLGGYPEFVRAGLARAGRPVQLVLAAHHHNLQAFEVSTPRPSLQLGLGSGARAEPPLSLNHPDARFGRMALGFARIDLLGRGPEERLAVTLIETANLPIVFGLQPPRAVARFEVDREGRVRSQQIAGPAFEAEQHDDRTGYREREHE